MNKNRKIYKPLSLLLSEENNPKLSMMIEKYFIKKFEISKFNLESNPESFVLNLKEYNKLKKTAEKFIEGKDVTFDIKYRWFYNVRLNIKKGVFVPQPDTEGIVDLILDKYKGSKQKSISGFEIGTGTGAISIAITKNNNKIRIDTVDKSKKACSLAQVNAIENGVFGDINFIRENFLSMKFDEKYDFIVSNPPYIDKKDKTIEKSAKKTQPSLALYAKHSGIDFYNNIFKMSEKSLKKGGVVFLEIGYNQKEILEKIIPPIFKSHKFYKDLNKNYRFLVLEK